MVSMLVSGVPEDAIGWVPASILLWALGAACAIILSAATIAVSIFKREVHKLDLTLDKLDTRLVMLEDFRGEAASRTMLTSMGDRLTISINNAHDKVAAMDKSVEGRLSVLESYLQPQRSKRR